jgi:hypothetical protein
MAERAELEGLPGVFDLGWWILMRPLSLHRRLKALGIDPNISALALFLGRGVASAFAARMVILMLIGSAGSPTVLCLSLHVLGADYSISGAGWGMAFGLGCGVFIGLFASAGAGALTGSVSELRGEWIPSPGSANGFFRDVPEVGRHLRLAELTLLPNQGYEQIQAASDRLRQIENSLRGRRDFESRTYRPAIAAWRALIDNWLADTKDAAERVLPDPFRAGDPLDP